jgi:hypothetical protein
LKQPKAPPVYRPQPVPKVLQAKKSAAQQPGKQSKSAPVAPPVYRPNPIPSVLLTKSVQATTQFVQPKTNARHTAVAAAYRPQPAPQVLQAKVAATRQQTTERPDRLSLLQPPQVSRVGSKGIVQPMLAGRLTRPAVSSMRRGVIQCVQVKITKPGTAQQIDIETSALREWDFSFLTDEQAVLMRQELLTAKKSCSTDFDKYEIDVVMDRVRFKSKPEQEKKRKIKAKSGRGKKLAVNSNSSSSSSYSEPVPDEFPADNKWDVCETFKSGIYTVGKRIRVWVTPNHGPGSVPTAQPDVSNELNNKYGLMGATTKKLVSAHLLPEPLGGRGDANNLTPLPNETNGWLSTTIEKVARDRVAAGKCIIYEVDYQYNRQEGVLENDVVLIPTQGIVRVSEARYSGNGDGDEWEDYDEGPLLAKPYDVHIDPDISSMTSSFCSTMFSESDFQSDFTPSTHTTGFPPPPSTGGSSQLPGNK